MSTAEQVPVEQGAHHVTDLAEIEPPVDMPEVTAVAHAIEHQGVPPPAPADIRWPKDEDRPTRPPVRLSQEVLVIIDGVPVTREELHARTGYSSASVPAARRIP